MNGLDLSMKLIVSMKKNFEKINEIENLNKNGTKKLQLSLEVKLAIV
ncbi:MAG: hypothetical protein RIR98_1463 [Bacteroidota bacterium]